MADILYMGKKKFVKNLRTYATLAKGDFDMMTVVDKMLKEKDATIFSLFFSQLSKCLGWLDNISELMLTGPDILFKKLEKNGFKDTLNWVIKQVEDFSFITEKMSEELYIFRNFKYMTKAELKVVAQIMLKYHSDYLDLRLKTTRLMSVNPLFVPILAILQFKKKLVSG